MINKIRVGTRSSKLAMWQTEHVAVLLNKGGFETEIIPMETKGDKVLTAPFAEIGTKGLFTEELEEKLLSAEIDIAVHSAKDMQTDLPEGLELIAFMEREQPHDVLVSLDKNFSFENENILIGTSSTRRRALLKHFYPHVNLTDARGNLQTRFRKMEEGQYQAMILAYAGVHRMGLDRYILKKLPLQMFTPIPGQGSIAIESSKNVDSEKRKSIRQILNDDLAEKTILAERAFLRLLQGGCSIPVFGYSYLEKNVLQIMGGVVSLDGKEMIREQMEGELSKPEKLGEALAEKMFSLGAMKIINEVKSAK